MLVLITYDVNLESPGGAGRLRRVAKMCTNYGQRVQNSVFECLLDPAQLCLVKDKLRKLMDEERDSIRIYHLGERYEHKIECMGKDRAYDVRGSLIF